MHVHFQCKGWLAFQVTQYKQSLQDSMWVDLKSCKSVPRRGCKVYIREEKTSW